MWKSPVQPGSEYEETLTKERPSASAGVENAASEQDVSPSPNGSYAALRGQRPGLLKRAQLLFALSLVLVDVGSTWLAFYFAHELTELNLTPRLM